MASLRFTVLVGGDCPCHLLETDQDGGGGAILFDCGWDETFDPQLLDPIIRYCQFDGSVFGGCA